MSINIFDISMNNPTFIFVDGSYYNFYRYFALLQWWKNVNPEEPLEDPYQNEQFVEKFKKIHVEHLQQISKKLKLHKSINPILIVGKDCKRENIWRNELLSEYKANRDNISKENAKDKEFFFKLAYDELFNLSNIDMILKHPKLEADDCIAISVKHICNNYPFSKIYIITSDSDYLQLQNEKIDVINLMYKKLKTSGNNERDLLKKIIMGDISDNIPSVFPKCGLKTGEKCCEDKEYLLKKMNGDKNYYTQYELNKKLIDFNMIPEELSNEFLLSIK